MTHKVILSDNAEDDLFSIASYIAERADREVAYGFVERIRQAGQTLADFPKRGTPHPGFGAEVRSIPFERRATIFYRVEPEKVIILHIAHAGRDPDRLFDIETG